MIANIRKFIRKDSSAGIMLLGITLVALLVANSPLNDIYDHLLELKFAFGFPFLHIEKTILEWINHGLMAIFFLLVGLEIKSELKFGRPSRFRSAFFPVIAAMAGATVPSLIFWAFINGTGYMHRWAIPMTTDIAFVIGIIAMLGSRLPGWVNVFITAIAVVDDLIAVLVVAFFYTSQISLSALGMAGISLLVLLFPNFKKVNNLIPYMLVGFVIMWWAVFESGMHAIIEGVVILAFTIPLHGGWDLNMLKDHYRRGFELFEQAGDEKKPLPKTRACII